MAQDVEAMVERTVDMLLARIGQPPGTRLPPQEPVPCRWVERATVRPASHGLGASVFATK
jgi:DNA-binding LacI/PurR family transcriptional regulator